MRRMRYCSADGGAIELHDHRLPFWGVGRIDCRFDKDGAKETGSFETIGGHVTVRHG
jgi:hypothetical protein